MKNAHVEELLIPHLRGELEGAERAQVEGHLPGCERCRASLAAFSRLIGELERTAPPAPPVHWGAYQAELREKLGGRAAWHEPRARWLIRPLPAALAAGLVAALLYVGLPGLPRGGRVADEHAMDSAVLASNLDMFARFDVVEQLDLFENFDVIGGLDRLPAHGDS